MTDLKGQKEGRERKGSEERRDEEGRHKEKESRRGSTLGGGKKEEMHRRKKGETLTKEKEYIATYVNTYQLISSEFLSSLKHRPKVDCGRQKTNKTVRNSGKGLKCMMSYTVITQERGDYYRAGGRI